MYSYYVIKKGDTLYSIASRFNTTVGELRNLNNLSPNKILMPGEVITVPVNQDMAGQNNNVGNNNDLFTTYTVQRGDNLYSIAEKYNISPNTLMMINGINNKMMLTPGQNLLVPKPYIRTYLTQNGDTIQSIMQDKRISISNLLNYNKQIYLLSLVFSPNFLQINLLNSKLKFIVFLLSFKYSIAFSVEYNSSILFIKNSSACFVKSPCIYISSPNLF